ncbi:PAS domain-containing sensor histidine kinase [Pedobacter endophyticus]|uniref:histidine kinase n=1 Tax=Pedobacter endophyticus TaxID=2789740 RepID=A0A7S9PZ77_9SPHI|nr:ATP-binding protein [Pedobacter endophyticus]QPH39650.1 PAS domain-containing protein [Pedobacter endophyticus]
MQINLDDNASIFYYLIEESPMPIGLYVGEEMVIKVANKALLKAWGRDKAVIGKPLSEALPELINQPFLEILERVRHTGVAYEGKEDRVELINNGTLQVFYFDFIYKPLKDTDGNVWGILNNATDITELVNARLRIKANEELFRKMIQDAPVAIGILRGKNFVIEQANADLLNLWGKTESVIGLELIDGLPELIDQPFPKLLTSVYESGVSHHGYETMAKIERDGVLQDCYFNFVYDPIRNGNNEVTGIMVVANEITTLVKSRMEVAKSEERFRNLLLDTPMATAYYETEDIVLTLVNDEMLNYWGKDKSILGKKLEDAVPELKSQPFIGIIKEVYRTGVPYHADQQEATLVVDGQPKTSWFNFTYKPLRNADGQVYAILHAAMDVTKQVQLQQQKDEFLGIASHELKTPVTSIKAYTQVLERMIRNDGDEKKAAMVHKMDLQLNRLTGLIGDLLDVTKIQSGKMTFNPINFDFDLAVIEIVEEMQHISAKHHINMHLNSNAIAYADKERIGQVITNFIANAIKYSSDANSIDVSSYARDNEIVLSVQDYGIGISKELQHLVFDQFYRVSGNLQHTYPGLGLGLYISAEIVKSEGGRIWVESEEGKGSTFYFSLKINPIEL